VSVFDKRQVDVLCVSSTIRQAALATVAFHKVVRQHYSGELGEFIIFWCEIIEIDSVFRRVIRKKDIFWGTA